MNRLITYLFFIPLLLITFPAWSATYTMTELNGTALDNPPGATVVSWDNTDTSYPNDDDKVEVNIGFDFRFADTDYSQVRILTNGILQFGASSRMHRDWQNENLPTNQGDRFISVYWDDLVDDGPATVTYGSMGTAPNRRFVVTWDNVRAYSNSSNRYDFQVVLYENGDIRFRYDNNTANGVSATIGVEVDNSDVTLYSYNTTSVRTDFDLLFKNSLLSLPAPVISWQFDEDEWTGTAGEVFDSSGNGLNGTAIGGATTAEANPAISGSVGTCRYGDFDGNDDLIQIADTASLDLTTAFTIGVWINIDSFPASGLKSILSKDENFEFHVDSDGHIYWWWNDSSGAQSFTSNTSITAGQWQHIVIRFQAGQQDIFIDGINRGSASNAQVPISNSDPFQIGGDQGFAGREFNGLIDEVNVYDTALSNLQILTLLNQTHPCTAQSVCGASFPDGAASYNNGTIDFGYNAQLFFSDSNLLDFDSVSLNQGSNVLSCVTEECDASGDTAPALPLPAFPDTSFSTDFTVSSGGTDTLGDSGINEYDDVRARSESTLNISSAFGVYYMDTLRLDFDSTLNLVAGDYWIRDLTLSSSSTITVSGGTARIFVQNDISVGSSSLINSPGANSAGDASELLIVGYGDVRLRSSSTTSALIYAVGDLRMDSPSYLFGAVTADDVTLNSEAQIRFQSRGVTQLDFGSLCDTSCALGSFAITQPDYALACPETRATVTVSAFCDDGATLKSDYTGTVDLSGPDTSTFYDAATGGSQISSYTFQEADGGTTDFYLYFNNEDPDVRVTVTDSAAGVISTASQGTDFRAYGFLASGYDDEVACSTDSAVSSTDVTLTAYGRINSDAGEECEVITGFDGDKALDVWYTVDTTGDGAADAINTALQVGNTLINDQADTVEDNVTATFTNGVATVPLSYGNAGNVLGVNFRHNSAPYDGSEFGEMASSASNIVFYPSSFALSAVDTVALNNTSASGGTVHPAGEDFSLTITAQCASGGVADDYQPNASDRFEASLERTGPVGAGVGSEGQLALSNSIQLASSQSPSFASTGLTPGQFSNGTYTFNQASYSEVGLIRLRVKDSNYFGRGDVGESSLDIGRFVPHHFRVDTVEPGDFDNGCGSFTYIGQPFEYGVPPTLRITPRNEADAITQNYIADGSDNYQKLDDPNDLSFIAPDITSGNAGVDGTDLNVVFSMNAGSLVADGASLLYTLSAADTFSYEKVANAQVAPFTASFDITLSNVNDGEAAGIIGQNGSASHVFQPDMSLIQQRYGRLVTENAFGPETVALPQTVKTEFWNGSDFEENSDDGCTAITPAMISIDPAGASGDGILDIEIGDGDGDPDTSLSYDQPFTAGSGNFEYSPPGAGDTGSLAMELDLTTLPWLQYDWDGDGTAENPPQRIVIFGQYRGHDRIIYWEEVTY